MIVAALLFEVLARGLGTAWRGTRIPMQSASAVAIARAVAAQAGSAVERGDDPATADGRVDRFGYVTTVASLTLSPRPSGLAPPPGPTTANPRATSNESELRRITVVVTAPSSRRVRLDTIRLVWPH